MENSFYPSGEIRKFARKPHTQFIAYTIAHELNKQKKFNLNGRIVDISDAGLGIETGYPLMPGHTLWFNNLSGYEAGAVKWSMKLNKNYRAGIEIAERSQSLYYDKTKFEDKSDTSDETKEYISLLDTATEQFINTIAAIERKCTDATENSEELLMAIEKASNDMLSNCEHFEEAVKDKDVLKKVRIEFHEKTNPILSKSYFINRIRTWPQGQQGDYKTLEFIYKNSPRSEGIGYFLDLCSLNAPLAVGVRNRIKHLEEILRDELKKRQQLAVLNIACGSCRELMGLAPDIIASGAQITCVDNDSDALNFAQSRLSHSSLLPQIEFYKYNALRMFDDELNMIEFGNQDIIYSVGLFDYLPDDFLVKLLRALYNLLNPGGKLLAAFKDAGTYRSQEYHWFADWDGFLQRTTKDFDRILVQAGIPEEALSVTREESGVIIFYIASNRGI